MPSPAWHFEQPCDRTSPREFFVMPIHPGPTAVQKSLIVLILPRGFPSALMIAGVWPRHWECWEWKKVSASSWWQPRQGFVRA